MTSSKSILTIAGLVLSALPIQATILAAWDFGPGNDGSAISLPPTTLAPFLSTSILTRGAGASGRAANFSNTDVFNTTFDRADLPAAVSNNAYFQWFVTSITDTLALSQLDYSVYAQNNGANPELFSGDLQYSLNGFSTAGTSIHSFAGVTPQSSTPFLSNPQTVVLSGIAELQNIAPGTTVTFRFYGFKGASWTDQGFGAANGNDLVIQGEAVPEPALVASLGGLAALLVVGLRRRPN